MTDGRSPEERERARLERERRRATRNGDTVAGSTEGGPSRKTIVPEAPRPPKATPQPGSRQTPPPRREKPVPRETAESGAAVQPPRAGRHTRRRAVAIFAATAAVAIFWVLTSIFQPFAGDGAGNGSMRVNIPRGSSVAEIGKILAENEVVPSARIFKLRAGWSGKSDEFEAGDYLFGKGMSYIAAIDRLAAGPNAGPSTFIVIEGRSRRETAREWAKAGRSGDYLQASLTSSSQNLRRYGAPSGVKNLEGFLFPATYDTGGKTGEATGDNLDAAGLVALQLKAFKRNLRQIPMSYARSKNLTTFDVVTIASLVEREVQVPRERKLVAAVIYNRLKQGIPLGIDATTRFETDNWTTPLTNAQLRKDTPYNTRINRGLPPGPIGSPGLESLKAAARPARVGFIYYVANPCKPGSHSFSSTAEQFQRDVERYKRAREAAGGKQPSGC
ncbi:MAG: endolytic transglycosylase MltG [Actinobacteria bacterium]|nr:endolytic transglycosylase MltG [Actinomycetota bacterium]